MRVNTEELRWWASRHSTIPEMSDVIALCHEHDELRAAVERVIGGEYPDGWHNELVKALNVAGDILSSPGEIHERV